MNILGIRYGHDASAALIQDGDIVADVSEERFTRTKNDTSFPNNAIGYCLEAGGIGPEDIDILALPNLTIPEAFFVFFRFPERVTVERFVAEPAGKKPSIRKTRKEMNRPEPPFPPHAAPVLPLYHQPFTLSGSCRVVLVEHHLAHAASACFTSGNAADRVLAVTLDGCGDDVSSAVWRFEHNTLELLRKFDCTASLGWFYANATEGMGWRHGSDEWKIMGLAPYGNPKPGALKGFYPEYDQGTVVRPHPYGRFGRWNDHGANHYHGKDAAGLREDLSAPRAGRLCRGSPARVRGTGVPPDSPLARTGKCPPPGLRRRLFSQRQVQPAAVVHR